MSTSSDSSTTTRVSWASQALRPLARSRARGGARWCSRPTASRRDAGGARYGRSCARPRGSWPSGPPGPEWPRLQSRSGPPSQPWLEPDVRDHLTRSRTIAADVVVVPIGFVSDHMEVVYDLDTEPRQRAGAWVIGMVRAATRGRLRSSWHDPRADRRGTPRPVADRVERSARSVCARTCARAASAASDGAGRPESRGELEDPAGRRPALVESPRTRSRARRAQGHARRSGRCGRRRQPRTRTGTTRW